MAYLVTVNRLLAEHASEEATLPGADAENGRVGKGTEFSTNPAAEKIT